MRSVLINGRWVTNDRIIIEYCGVDISSIDNQPLNDSDDYLEMEVHRMADCPEDLKIGNETEVDWFGDDE